MRIFDKCVLFYCRLGIAGLSPKAPGTCGSALACLLAPFFYLPFSTGARAGILLFVFVTGAFAATRAERLLGRKDPGEVVIDELLGVWFVLLPFAQPSVSVIVAAFIFFRLFDIWKPWPVRVSENWLPGGFGVMIDDMLAGAWALVCVSALRGMFYFMR